MNLIFDIGYNVGKFTEACFDKYPDVDVVAVEANPALCNVHEFNGLHIWNRVVSDKDDEDVDFYIEPRQSGISTASIDFMENSRFKKGSKNLRRGSGRWAAPVQIRSITIDALIGVYGVPDLIKIDVEGYEYTALLGLTNMAGDICFEWHEEDYGSVIRSINHLMRLGYTKFGVIGWYDEGDVFDKATFSSKGDPHLVYPDEFYVWGELDMETLVKPNRRINYGMLFAKI